MNKYWRNVSSWPGPRQKQDKKDKDRTARCERSEWSEVRDNKTKPKKKWWVGKKKMGQHFWGTYVSLPPPPRDKRQRVQNCRMLCRKRLKVFHNKSNKNGFQDTNSQRKEFFVFLFLWSYLACLRPLDAKLGCLTERMRIAWAASDKEEKG